LQPAVTRGKLAVAAFPFVDELYAPVPENSGTPGVGSDEIEKEI